jgi:hypothetical protein
MVRESMTLTVYDPSYRTRRLAVHANLAPAEARELAKAYRGLGYPPHSIVVTTDKNQAAKPAA